jgi:transcriptional regulator with XRE-family HTH domain
MKATVLKELRKEKKITQEQLAKKLGVARSSIAMVENGKQEGGREFTRKVAEYFDTSIDYLEGRTNDKQGVSSEKDALVSNFISFLVESGIIKDENNIDKKTEEMILEMVKKEVSNLKKEGK